MTEPKEGPDGVKAHYWKRGVGQPKYPPSLKEGLRAIKCEMCNRLFGDHSAQEFDACLDRKIEKEGGWRLGADNPQRNKP